MSEILLSLHDYHQGKVTVFGEIYEMEKWYQELKLDYSLQPTKEDIMYYAFQKYGTDCFRKIRGAYNCLLQMDDEIRIYTPPFNLMPLYYTCKEDEVYISDSFFALAKARNEKLIVNTKSLLELFSFSPCHALHQSVYKHIYALSAGYVLIYKQHKIKIEKWYDIPVYDIKDSYEDCVQKVKTLVKDSIHALKDGVNASFLSGGLDSSVIVAECASPSFHTYSLDYEENSLHFQANDFQKSIDTPFIDQMCQKYDLSHQSYTITQKELCDSLEAALWAREVPGMADIDASLYWFLSQIKAKDTVLFSGECADEVFGGYPWFYRKEYDDCESFPFLNYQKERILLLSKQYRHLPFSAYLQHQYDECMSQIKQRKENAYDQRFQKMRHLTFDYFMQTLVVRQYTMSKAHGVTIRVPFADVALMEYVYNLPAKYCCLDGNEKHILRDAFQDILPNDIYERKKNPFPKTHHPVFAEMMAERLSACVQENSILLQIFDKDALNALIQSKGESFQVPWFGQLMSGPQLLAYLYTLHVWLSDDRIQLDLSC